MTNNSQTRSRIEWIGSNCRLLAAIRTEFAATRPFEGLCIGTAIHLEPKTAALLLALRAGGARIVSTGNIASTQQATVEYLTARGIEVIGARTTEPNAHEGYLDALMAG